MHKIKPTCCLALLTFFISHDFVSARAQEKGKAAPTQSSQNDAGQLVKDIVQHELHAQAKDQSFWCFRRLQQKDSKPAQTFVACQSQAGEIDRLVAVNGHALDEKQQRDEDLRTQSLLKNPARLRKQKQQQHEDAQHAEKLLNNDP